MVTKRLFLLALIAAALLPFILVNSCRNEPYGIELLDTVCFNTQVLRIFQTSCGMAGCHDAGTAEGDFVATNFESIAALVVPYKASSSKLYSIISNVNGPNFMPPNRSLSKEQRSIIMVWIEQGAKNTICLPNTGNNEEDPLNYDSICFNQNILPILLSSCGKSGCHDASSHLGDYVLTSYSTLRQNSEAIVPYNLYESKVYKVITETDQGDVMPPPPNSPLTSEQKQLFSTWITQGALNSDCPWTACDTINPISFAQNVWPIVQNNCLGCHSGSSPLGGVNLSDYTNIKYYAETLRNGTPILTGSLRQVSGFVPMPPSGMLNTCQLRTFELWINQGILNN